MKKLFHFILMSLIVMVTMASALDYFHGDTCERTDGIPVDAKFINKPLFGRKSVERGTFPEFEIEAVTESMGYAICEIGIYNKNDVKGWCPDAFAIGPWDALSGNCVEGESHVITKRFYLQTGEPETAVYKVYVPHEYEEGNDYVAHLNCFNHCYLCDPNTYESFSCDVIDLKLTGREIPVHHCDNFYTDKDESDIDCGGDECMKCETGLRCKDDSDCESNICIKSKCEDERPSSDPPLPPTEDNFGSVITIGIIIFILIAIFMFLGTKR